VIAARPGVDTERVRQRQTDHREQVQLEATGIDPHDGDVRIADGRSVRRRELAEIEAGFERLPTRLAFIRTISE